MFTIIPEMSFTRFNAPSWEDPAPAVYRGAGGALREGKGEGGGGLKGRPISATSSSSSSTCFICIYARIDHVSIAKTYCVRIREKGRGERGEPRGEEKGDWVGGEGEAEVPLPAGQYGQYRLTAPSRCAAPL